MLNPYTEITVDSKFLKKKSAVICVITQTACLSLICGYLRNRRITLNWPADFRRTMNNYVRSYIVQTDMIEFRLLS
ncbi:MAG: hypothetical protein GQF41_2009 [Candidatus Rifleibacterium amylolyticum]|nr:MAG: hypothetical protein GQF41_2009 [Candidatus Rifleibacterium amylolyticum]